MRNRFSERELTEDKTTRRWDANVGGTSVDSLFRRVDGPARLLGGEHVHAEILVAAHFVQKVSLSFQKAVHSF